MRSVRMFLAVLVALLAASCGDDSHFRLEGTIEGEPTMNLRVVYYAKGALQGGVTAAQKGKFEFFGDAPQPALVTVYDYDYRPLAYVWARNGEQIQLQMADSPLKTRMDGNEANRRWSEFLRANSDSLAVSATAANRAVERYVAANPEDVVSTLLMVTLYDASCDALRADSLMESIATAARPASLASAFSYITGRLVMVPDTVAPFVFLERNDSVSTFDPHAKPYSLIAVVANRPVRADSIADGLRRISRMGHRSVQTIELSADGDTIDWKRMVRNDTASWTQGWVAAGVAAPSMEALGLPRLPYFIVCDSVGRRLLRTPSISAAETFLSQKF